MDDQLPPHTLIFWLSSVAFMLVGVLNLLANVTEQHHNNRPTNEQVNPVSQRALS